MDNSESLSQEVVGQEILTLCGLYESLISTLEQEREALRSRDSHALEESTSRKLAICERIEAQQLALPAAIADLVAQTPADSREKLETAHNHLTGLAREAKDLNAVNGKIISRSQQSVRELIGVLHGQNHHALYGAHGNSARGNTSTGPAIANA